MNCPETGGTCFDVDCQLNGCQGDGIRRATAIANGDQPAPRSIPDPENDRYRREQIRADIVAITRQPHPCAPYIPPGTPTPLMDLRSIKRAA